MPLLAGDLLDAFDPPARTTLLTPDERLTAQGRPILAIASDPCGTLLFTADDRGLIRGWDVHRGTVIAEFSLHGHTPFHALRYDNGTLSGKFRPARMA